MDRRTAVGHEASGITPAARPWQCRHVYLCAARPQNTAGPLGQSGAACRAACKAQPAHFVVKGSCIAQRFQPVSRCFAFPGPAARTRPDIPVMITAAAASGSVTPVGESRAGPSCGGTKGWGCAAAAEAALVHRAVPVPFRSVPRAPRCRLLRDGPWLPCCSAPPAAGVPLPPGPAPFGCGVRSTVGSRLPAAVWACPCLCLWPRGDGGCGAAAGRSPRCAGRGRGSGWLRCALREIRT